jgi:hypothetical protein
MSVSVVGDGDLYYFKEGEWRSLVESPPIGENVSGASVLDVCRNWTLETDMQYPNYGGTATVNSVNVGLFDYVYKTGNQTPTSDMSEWFTGANDARSAWVLVDGDLTVNSGVMFRPPTRKLFTVVYVTGDLAVNGTMTMTTRGANHNGTGESGGAVTAADLRIATGTFSAVVDPQVPAAGGAGGAGGSNAAGSNGSAGSAGGTGGGGGGTGLGSSPRVGVGGDGSSGTSFSGGSGGGGAITTSADLVEAGDAEPNGGQGGFGIASGNTARTQGCGNPFGTLTGGAPPLDYIVQEGTGGTLIIICEGALSGSGVVNSNGANNGGAARAGGSTGGGSITILYGSDTSTITPAASGGVSATGGNGGAGTARKLAL